MCQWMAQQEVQPPEPRAETGGPVPATSQQSGRDFRGLELIQTGLERCPGEGPTWALPGQQLQSVRGLGETLWPKKTKTKTCLMGTKP